MIHESLSTWREIANSHMPIMVSHVSTHTRQQTPGAHYNNIADSLSKLHACSKALHEQLPKISDTALDTIIPPVISYPLAEWAHITSGDRGVTALTDWGYCCYIFLILALAKVVVNNYLPLLSKKTLEGSGRHVSLGVTDTTHNGKLIWGLRAAASLC